MTPRLRRVRQDETHRLIPTRYSDESVLARLAEPDEPLDVLFELDSATNDRLAGEANLLPGIGVHELLFGVSHAHIVNAAFTHAHPTGSRFNGPDRGAWYCSFEVETALAEVAFHKSVEYQEIGRFDDSVTYETLLADFTNEFHDVRRDPRFGSCLDPASYVGSQQLAARLIGKGAVGIIFPSVRRPRGTNLACFRPAVVANVRRGDAYRLTWSGDPAPRIALEKRAPKRTARRTR